MTRLLFLVPGVLLVALTAAPQAQPACFNAVTAGPTRLVTSTAETGSGGPWTVASVETRTYDARSRLAASVTDYASMPRNPDLGYYYTYDADDRIASWDMLRDGLLESPYGLYVYADDGRSYEHRIGWRSGGTTWEAMIDRNLDTYNDACQLVDYRFEWKEPAGEWNPGSRTVYDYVDGRRVESRQYGMLLARTPVEANLPMSRFQYTYAGGVGTGYTYDRWNAASGTYTPSRRCVDTHSGGRLAEQRCDSWSGSAFVPSYTETHTYTAAGDLALTERISVTGNRQRWTYVYEANTVAGETPPSAAGARLAVAGANPFGTSTRVRLSLDAPEAVAVTVHDALGRAVAVLHQGMLGAGDHDWTLGERLSPGVYVVRAQGTTTAATARVVRARR